jgi:hypothetical protein
MYLGFLGFAASRRLLGFWTTSELLEFCGRYVTISSAYLFCGRPKHRGVSIEGREVSESDMIRRLVTPITEITEKPVWTKSRSGARCVLSAPHSVSPFVSSLDLSGDDCGRDLIGSRRLLIVIALPRPRGNGA